MSFDAATYNWAACAIELLVDDVETSKAFYCETLGFQSMYERPGFAYLDYHGGRSCWTSAAGHGKPGKWKSHSVGA